MKTPSRSAPGEFAATRMAFVHISGLCWNFFEYHLRIKARLAGVELIYRPISTMGEQVAEIESLLRENVDVLLFRPVATDDAGLLAVLERAQSEGVHLISIDGMPGGTTGMCSISADNFGGQAKLAEYTFNTMGGKGKIAYLQGDLRTEAGVQRNKGLQSVLRRFPEIDLVFTETFDWSSTLPNYLQGIEMAKTALHAHPGLGAIISATDEGGLGVNAVLGQLGCRGKVIVTGFDGMPEGITAVGIGDLEATASQPLDRMAQLAFDLAVGMTRGEVTTLNHCILDVDLVTRATIGDAAMRALRVFPEVAADLNQQAREQKNTATFLEALFHVMPTTVLVKDAKDLRYVSVNRAREAWLNTPHGFQLGKTVHDFYPADVAARYDAEDYGILASGTPLEIAEEESFVEGFGKRYSRTRKIPILDATGKSEYLMVISEDITRKKAANEALALRTAELEKTNLALKRNHEKLVEAEKMAALGVLVAGISHELNTPIGNALMAVTTYSDHTRSLAGKHGIGLMRSMLSDYLSDAVTGIEILERNLRRAAELIRSFKQISVDQSSSQARTFSLATVVRDMLVALSPSLKKTPFVVQQDIPADLTLDSFPGPLEQVLMNLINNSVIHGFEGRSNGLITISARVTQPGWVELVVQDDGVGIAPERIKQIFDPFFSTKFGKGGSGLGLSISNNIVTRLLGGQIAVSSTPGVGTRFSLILPLQAGRHDG